MYFKANVFFKNYEVKVLFSSVYYITRKVKTLLQGLFFLFSNKNQQLTHTHTLHFSAHAKSTHPNPHTSS